MVVLTLALVAVAIVDVARRRWRDRRTPTAWLVLLLLPAALTLASFSLVGPVAAAGVVAAYVAARGAERRATAS